MRSTILLISIILLSFSSFSQDWETYYEDDKLSIDWALSIHNVPSEGRKHERIVFRYVNKTPNPIDVSFKRVIGYDNKELSDSPERIFNIQLEANETISYDDNHRSKTYYIFSKDLNNTIKRKLSGLEITNISISAQ